ncbi:MAG: Gfo/Idh/MocA family oxidoreductase [Bifidobacteriaceae bacterium]|jgi:predicted dehydrogenase|nr:Gfo/Idh/MocA family oxidoreductase [Bifidobacteriaceae bacterium]
MNQLGWGILATGDIAHAFTEALIRGGLRVTAVGSRSKPKARAFAQHFGIARYHPSYQELCRDEGVDIVYVASPHAFHAEHALLALSAGKHTLIEKPLALNGAQARLIERTATDAGLVAMEAMRTRFLPHMAAVREVVRSGRLGEVRAVTADITHNSNRAADHRIHNLELGGGALLDLGVYAAAFAFDLLGAPREVKATAVFEATGADAQCAASFLYGPQTGAYWLAALNGRGPNTAAVIGSEARIEIARPWHCDADFAVIAGDDRVVMSRKAQALGHGFVFQALEMERLATQGPGDPGPMPLSESVKVMDALDAARKQIGLVYPSEAPK